MWSTEQRYSLLIHTKTKIGFLIGFETVLFLQAFGKLGTEHCVRE
jgi:hypothetical protein